MIDALRLAEKALAGVRAGQHGPCVVEIRGIGGSYAHGNPRFGLYPKTWTYDQAMDLEMQKAHGPGGVLIRAPSIWAPSDVDMSLIIRRIAGGRPTIGDAIQVTKAVHHALEKVFAKTGVFVSAHDGDPMRVVPIGNVIRRLAQWQDQTPTLNP